MKDDRLRVPVEEKDLLALGRAAYTFARLEWQAVWCMEKLSPGYVGKLSKKTAGTIAIDLTDAVAALTDVNLQSALNGPANEFKRLVADRNGILHGKPGTAPDGSQLLFRDGVPWSSDRLEDVADEFAACEQSLNSIFYGLMGGP